MSVVLIDHVSHGKAGSSVSAESHVWKEETNKKKKCRRGKYVCQDFIKTELPDSQEEVLAEVLARGCAAGYAKHRFGPCQVDLL